MSSNQEQGASATSVLRPGRAEGPETAELNDGLAHLRSLLERQDLRGARAWVEQLRERWPDAERVQHFARILARPAVTVQPGQPHRSRAREYRWLRDHAAEHPGCWLAVLGDDLIAADPDFAGVLAAVNKLQHPDDVLIHFQPRSHQ